MPWTSEEAMSNIVLYGACNEGRVWAANKDSDAIWNSTDEMAARYLFWWATVNAGMENWKTKQEVLGVLKKILDVSSLNLVVSMDIDVNNPEFEHQVLYSYTRTERLVGKISDLELKNFRLRILPLILELKPSI